MKTTWRFLLYATLTLVLFYLPLFLHVPHSTFNEKYKQKLHLQTLKADLYIEVSVKISSIMQQSRGSS